jgi:hypothetical protein
MSATNIVAALKFHEMNDTTKLSTKYGSSIALDKLQQQVDALQALLMVVYQEVFPPPTLIYNDVNGWSVSLPVVFAASSYSIEKTVNGTLQAIQVIPAATSSYSTFESTVKTISVRVASISATGVQGAWSTALNFTTVTAQLPPTPIAISSGISYATGCPTVTLAASNYVKYTVTVELIQLTNPPSPSTVINSLDVQISNPINTVNISALDVLNASNVSPLVGTGYKLSIWSVNALGRCVTPYTLTFYTVPDRPVLTVSNITTSTATLTWAPLAGVASYTLNHSGLDITTGIISGMALHFPILSRSLSKSVSLVASNAAGSSQIGTTTYMTVAGYPAAPLNLTVTSISEKVVMITWTITPENDSYILTVGSFPDVTIGGPQTSTHTYTYPTPFTSVVQVTVVLKAVNVAGTGPAATTSFTCVPIVLPLPSIDISLLTCNSVTVSWSNMSSSCSGYQTSPMFNQVNYLFDCNTVTSTFTGLLPDCTYTLSMIALKDTRVSTATNVSFMTHNAAFTRYACITMSASNNVFDDTLTSTTSTVYNKFVLQGTDVTGNKRHMYAANYSGLATGYALKSGHYPFVYDTYSNVPVMRPSSINVDHGMVDQANRVVKANSSYSRLLVYLQRSSTFVGNYLSSVNGTTGNYSIMWSHQNMGSKLGFSSSYITAQVAIPFQNDPTLDKWYACFMTFSKTTNTVNMYVNSSSSYGSSVAAASFPVADMPTYLGLIPTILSSANISVAEVTTYDFALSTANIDTELQRIKTKYGNLSLCVLPLPSPANVTNTVNGGASVTFTWQNMTSSVSYVLTVGSPPVQVTPSPTSSPYTHTFPVPYTSSTTIPFTVAAVNSAGIAGLPYSGTFTTVYVMPPAVQPYVFRITTTSATINWTLLDPALVDKIQIQLYNASSAKCLLSPMINLINPPTVEYLIDTSSAAGPGGKVSFVIQSFLGLNVGSISGLAFFYNQCSAPVMTITSSDTTSVTFAWAPVNGALSYILYVDNTAVVRTISGGAISYIYSFPISGTVVYGVYTLRAIGIASALSPSVEGILSGPVSIPQAQVWALYTSYITTYSAVVNWSVIPATGILDSVKIVIYTVATPPVIITTKENVNPGAESYSVNTGVAGALCDWTIQSFLGTVPGVIVQGPRFVNLPPAPVLQQPVPTATNVTFNWTAIPNVTSYTLTMGGSVVSSTIAGTDTTYTSPISYTYAETVIATLVAVNVSGQSTPRQVTFTSVPVPTSAPTGVTSIATATTLTVSWSHLPICTSYVLTVNGVTVSPTFTPVNFSPLTYTFPIAYTSATSVPYSIAGVNSGGTGVAYNGTFTPVVGPPLKYAFINSANMTWNSLQQVTLAYDMSGHGRNMIPGSTPVSYVAAINSTNASMAFRTSGSYLVDIGNDGMMPSGSYTRMCVVKLSTLTTTANSGGNQIFMTGFIGSVMQHTFQSGVGTDPYGTIVVNTEMLAVGPQLYNWAAGYTNNLPFYPGKWYVMFQLYDSLTKICRIFLNGVACPLNSAVALNTPFVLGFRYTSLGGVPAPMTYKSLEVDWLEAATWDSLLSQADISYECTRIASTYGITLG